MRAVWGADENGRLYTLVSDMQLDAYGDYHKCVNGCDVKPLSASHGETCPECGWPEDDADE